MTFYQLVNEHPGTMLVCLIVICITLASVSEDIAEIFKSKKEKSDEKQTMESSYRGTSKNDED